MAMHEISVERAKEIATEKGLTPAKIRDTNIIQFTKRGGARFETIDWSNFQDALDTRGLGVYESGGWMKIMKKE